MAFNKLVRDKIPEIIKNNNETPITRILSDEEYQEVLESSGENRLEELADMLEVMIALANTQNASLEDIIKIADKKRTKRGGFQEKIFLENVK